MLKIEPSKEKLLNWSFLPPKEPLLAVGSNLVKSEADLEIVGKTFNWVAVTLVCAPVLSLLKILFFAEEITISSKDSPSSTNFASMFVVLPKVK